MLERVFIVFKIFLQFFSEFSFPVREWTEFGTKIFSPISRSISSPFWLKIMPKRGFLNFLIFCYFFRNFLSRVEYERHLGLNVFCPFLGLSHPYWLKIMPERGFFIFWFLLLFFSEFSFLDWVGTEFGTRIFFSLSRRI